MRYLFELKESASQWRTSSVIFSKERKAAQNTLLKRPLAKIGTHLLGYLLGRLNDKAVEKNTR